MYRRVKWKWRRVTLWASSWVKVWKDGGGERKKRERKRARKRRKREEEEEEEEERVRVRPTAKEDIEK